MKRPQVMIGAVIFAVALVIPLFLHNDYFLQVIFRLFLFATLGLAWNLVGGYAGQLSLGHAAYFGVGAYGLALLSKGMSPWLAIVGGVVLALFSAVIIGSVSFRLARTLLLPGYHRVRRGAAADRQEPARCYRW